MIGHYKRRHTIAVLLDKFHHLPPQVPPPLQERLGSNCLPASEELPACSHNPVGWSHKTNVNEPLSIERTQFNLVPYQSLLLQKVVGLLSFFAVLVLQFLEPMCTRTHTDTHTSNINLCQFTSLCASLASIVVDLCTFVPFPVSCRCLVSPAAPAAQRPSPPAQRGSLHTGSSPSQLVPGPGG